MTRADRVAVERAIAEVRAGRPVVVRAGGRAALLGGVESLAAEDWGPPAAASGRLVLTAPRLTRLGVERAEPGVVSLPRFDRERIATLALAVQARIDAPVAPADEIDRAALELMRLAWLAPAAVVMPDEEAEDAVSVSAGALLAYRVASAAALRIVARAPVPLDGAPDTEFVVFRGGEGLRDQVAVLVGRPDLTKPVRVRLHSACLTGDLFGSLTCDCGDQLRGAVKDMAEGDGGVLLYLDQEGRGNGFANKMRAYRLQTAGHDTYEADALLGFGLDGRHFDFAAVMLKLLGVSQVRLMTNNPVKIEALRRAGLQVVEIVPTLGRPTAQNARYIAAKREKGGHIFEP